MVAAVNQRTAEADVEEKKRIAVGSCRSILITKLSVTLGRRRDEGGFFDDGGRTSSPHADGNSAQRLPRFPKNKVVNL